MGRVTNLKAQVLARLAHRGQTDKSGVAYWTHPARVAAVVPAEAVPVAWLHDVIEDTWVSERLLRFLFSDEVVDAVVAITHLPKEPNAIYWERVRLNRLARIVKTYDILDNTSPDRMCALDEKTRKRLARKYQSAWVAIGAREVWEV